MTYFIFLIKTRLTQEPNEIGSRRRRGLGRIQGHLRIPLLKANSLTYFARALLDPRVLAVANGGAAVLRGVTPAN
jgi:hypothetical protein